MINDWKNFLETQGFEKIDRREFLRPSQPISALIYETPLRVGQREVRINVAIEVNDPWLSDREYHVMDLRGDVTPEGIYVHYNETPYWIQPEEKPLISSVINRCLKSWLDHWSNPHQLIQYFEDPVDIVMTRASATSQNCEHMLGVPAKRRMSPNEDHLLSLLYYHVGNFGKAMAAAERYLQFIGPKSAYEGEPERTIRQVEELRNQLNGQV